jgi:hypothetical protein
MAGSYPCWPGWESKALLRQAGDSFFEKKAPKKTLVIIYLAK